MTELSIITVSKNDPEGLTRTWRSVTRAPESGVEWIVIDAASNPETQAVIKDIRADGWKVISEQDDGIYDGMNKGVKHCIGRWILFMNAGDEISDDKVIKDVMETLKNTPPRSFVFGDAIESPPGGKPRVRPALSFELIEFGMPTSHQAIFYPRELLEEFPLQSGFITADWMQLLAMHANGVKGIHISRTICRFDTSGVSSVRWQETIRERVAHLKHVGRWNPTAARRYRRIFVHAWVANLLAAVLPRQAWVHLARFKKMAWKPNQGNPMKS